MPKLEACVLSVTSDIHGKSLCYYCLLIFNILSDHPFLSLHSESPIQALIISLNNSPPFYFLLFQMYTSRSPAQNPISEVKLIWLSCSPLNFLTLPPTAILYHTNLLTVKSPVWLLLFAESQSVLFCSLGLSAVSFSLFEKAKVPIKKVYCIFQSSLGKTCLYNIVLTDSYLVTYLKWR